jgi:hypothetical protein
METAALLISLSVGLGLSAACGFRVFVPPLVMSIISMINPDLVPLSSDFEWIGTWPALVAFSAATLLEICGYYLPWFDNLLDSVATPLAIMAGVCVSAASLGELDPLLRWSISLIAGGGSAGLTQGATVMTRLTSTLTTGGLANPVVSTIEGISSFLMAIVAILLPFLAVALFIGFVVFAVKVWRNRRRKKATAVV